ncbi:rab effector MyRIP [Trichomycterus rosablanca]|uniref:rab effector MyRIP n=1 Tax=Trichomycterus rosablanca TaxID=2290929 RepID=UPI002F357A0A
MGRKLDLSGLTEVEAEHVLKVVQRDMKLRKKEEDRISELKQEQEEEGARCLILAKQRDFNEHCCIRCCGPFSFLLKPRRVCLDCRYNVCKACCSYSRHESGYICTFCNKSRLLRARSLEWYYNIVKTRFKRFGSAKVLRTLYRKHRIEKGATDLPDLSAPEGSNDNDGSVCGSDSAFSKQSEGHSIAETLTVALRVAEEAIDEAITKAQSYRDSLEKQNEARYLCDHREELVEELATTIVQKIIQRGKRSDMQADYDFVWSQNHNSDLPSPTSASTSTQRNTDPQTCHKNSYLQRRSISALSLTSDESPAKTPETDKAFEAAEPEPTIENCPSLRRESRASILGWKSVDRLDNSSASSVLQSPDGNWIALQSSQHSRPSLLTKRKSLVFSVLEKESGVVSAYDEMGSDSEDETEQDSWGLALLQFHQRLSEETRSTDSKRNLENHPPITSPSSGHFTNTETLNSDSETSVAPPTRTRKPAYNIMMRNKAPPEPHLPYMPYEQHRSTVMPSHSPRFDALDVNFNPRVGEDSSEGEEQGEPTRKFLRRRRSKRDSSEQNQMHSSLYTAENSTFLLNTMMKQQLSQEPPPTYQSLHTMTPPDMSIPSAITPDPTSMLSYPPMYSQAGIQLGPGCQAYSRNDTLEHQLRSKLSELVSQISKEDVTSSEDEAIRKVSDRRCKIEKGSRVRQQERVDEAQKERDTRRDMERSKWEMERLSERWIERQISREHEGSDVVRQRRRDGDQRRESKEELTRLEGMRGDTEEQEKHMEKGFVMQEMDRQQVRQVGIDTGREEEVERAWQAQSNGPSTRTEQDTWKVTSTSEKASDAEKSVEEEDITIGEDLTEASVNEEMLQRSNSEDASEKGQEAHSTPFDPEEQVSPTEKCSAASLCSITTEVLKVLNATEELIGEAEGKGHDICESPAGTPLSSGPESKKLDQHLTKMEENVYLAAGTVYSLEGALSDLEDCARSISSSTTETELAFLEDQVATAAAQVQQSELQISDIEARISALKNAGLNVTACSRFSKTKPQTLNSSRHQRRKLPAPPATEHPETQVRPFSHDNSIHNLLSGL